MKKTNDMYLWLEIYKMVYEELKKMVTFSDPWSPVKLQQTIDTAISITNQIYKDATS